MVFVVSSSMRRLYFMPRASSCPSTVILVVASLFVSLVVLAEDLGPGALRLDGTFVQYQSWMLAMDAESWRTELDAMRRARLKMIILQWTGDGNTPFWTDSVDPAAIIFDYAAKHGIEVYAGLLKETISSQAKGTSDPLTELALRQQKWAEQVWVRYGSHTCFCGWYIPQEIALTGLPEVAAARFNTYYREVSTTCKELSQGKPVAIAPYFNGQQAPSLIGADLKRIVAGTGVDVVMLQDGVGARGWDEDVERVTPYFEVCRKVCEELGVRLWSDLECFTRDFAPAWIDRIQGQFTTEAAFVEKFVTFDFFHYMSPQRGAAQKELFGAYLAQFIDQPFRPGVRKEGSSLHAFE